MRLSLAAGVLLAACVSAEVISWPDKPTFCKDHDCPKFTVVDSNDRYELRNYEQSYWVTTSMPVTNYWQNRVDNRKAFYKLFGYITGLNDQATKMPMTAPVLKYHMKDTAIMAFMIPFQLYGKAPEPTEDGVRLFTSPPRMVYVKKFSGEGWNPDYVHAAKIKELRDDLKADNITITDDTFYVAGYDGPSVRNYNKHHEVWIAKP